MRFLVFAPMFPLTIRQSPYANQFLSLADNLYSPLVELADGKFIQNVL